MNDNKTRCLIITAMQDVDYKNPITASVEISDSDYIICADGGYEYAKKECLTPDMVMGDFDSASLEEIEASKISTKTFEVEKDDTDTMLSVKYAMSKGFENIIIIGGIGGDFGHTIANIQVLSYLSDMKCEAAIITPKEKIIMLDGETLKMVPSQSHQDRLPREIEITGVIGKKFSLFSYEERTTSVYIENAKYLLNDAVLTQSYPIGARNEFINENPVKIKIGYGRLLIVIER